MPTVAELLLAFVALYPVCTAALWVAGGVLFRMLDEPVTPARPDGGWPGVTLLIPAYNEASVIASSIRAALEADYPSWRCWSSTTAPPTTPRRPRGPPPAATRAAASSATPCTAVRPTG